jgi:hypothetical protein
MLVLPFVVAPLLAQSGPGTVKINDATVVRLSLVDSLSSATNKVDDPVHFEVTEDVKVGGIVAIPRGSTAVGHLVEAEARKHMGRSGRLNFTLDYVKAPDGTNLRLRATSSRKGDGKTGTVIVGTVLVSPLFLMMRGKDVEIPRGTEVVSYTDGDHQIALPGAAPGVVTGAHREHRPRHHQRPAA